jgi:lactoylglutathione lyase
VYAHKKQVKLMGLNNEGKMTGLAHIGLYISDIERTKKFYTEILGFEIMCETTLTNSDGVIKICFLSLGNLCIEAVQHPKRRELSDGWFEHVAIRVENIEAVKMQLEEKGVRFDVEDITFAPGFWKNGSKWILFRGPDNEHIEINEVL